MKWKKVFNGCHHGYTQANPHNPTVIIEQNHFGRKLWTVEINSVKIVDGGYDCFSFVLAKQIAIKNMN